MNILVLIEQLLQVLFLINKSLLLIDFLMLKFGIEAIKKNASHRRKEILYVKII